MGYKLEKRSDLIVPLPYIGNNFYKNHSKIYQNPGSKQYKIPLYLEVGKQCIELT